MQTQGGRGDPYGTFHLQLNAIPGQSGPPKTEWLNMGFWKDTTCFPEACEALALRLSRKVSLKPRGRVLEVGYGCGDFLLLQLSHPDLPRPSLLYGVTSLAEHQVRAKARVDLWLESDPQLASRTEINLLQGDAVWREGRHPLSPDSAYVFDTILALDCAYHFKTRPEFLRQSFTHLGAGGQIGLADVCFATTPPAIATFVLSSVLGVVPRANVVSIETYVQEMTSLGFVDVQVDDITAWVFPAFCDFLRTQGLKFRVLAAAFGWLQEQGGRFIIVTGTRPFGSTGTI